VRGFFGCFDFFGFFRGFGFFDVFGSSGLGGVSCVVVVGFPAVWPALFGRVSMKVFRRSCLDFGCFAVAFEGDFDLLFEKGLHVFGGQAYDGLSHGVDAESDHTLQVRPRSARGDPPYSTPRDANSFCDLSMRKITACNQLNH
jgi:hypothetical protein